MVSAVKKVSKGSGLSSELKDLFIAAMQNDVATLKSGLEHFDVNVLDDRGQTLLHYAAGHLAYGAVDFLLEQDGIDPTIRDDEGRTADFMPLQVYRSQGAKMFRKLMPICNPSNSEGEYIGFEV